MKTVLLALSALFVMLSSPAASGSPLLKKYRGKARVIIVSAPTADRARLAEQHVLWEKAQEGARERDLVLIELAEQSAAEQAAVREHFAIPAAKFTVLLIGKDGGEKARSSKPVELAKWFALIDTMPMRREEMRQR